MAYAYDAVGRVRNRTVTNGSSVYATSYGFVAGNTSLYGSTASSPLVSSITQPGMNLGYAYDSRGNIVSETHNGLTTSYAYDGMGQLTRVNDPHENATWVYEYDRGGNMTAAKRYAYTTGTLGTVLATTSYAYGDGNWKDKLTAVGGQTITYDAIGNMLTDGTHTNTWEYGRQLRQTALVSGAHAGVTYRYYHNHDGLRTTKQRTAGGTSEYTYYNYNGNNLVRTSHGDYAMHFFYDAQGKVSMARFWDGTQGKYYSYVYNLQGDVVKLVDNNGTAVVEYKYDAWGKPLSTTGTMAATLGRENPFRYRGYVYDEETKYYYLRSRYYDPGLRRFLSPDSEAGKVGSVAAHNLYTYCRNAIVIASILTEL